MSEEEQELRIQPEVSLDIVPSQQSAEAIKVDNNGLPSKTFCILPWVHLSTRPDGSMRVCCTANASSVGATNDKKHGGQVGILKTDDATEATSTTDGSLQTDGGLSVVKDAVFGDDIKLLSDAAVHEFGAKADVTLTHVHNTGLLLNAAMVVQFRDSAINIGSPADGDLDINADDEIELNSTLIDINGNVEISGTAVTTGVHTFTAVPVFPNNTVESADIQADAITGAKIADDAINSEHYTDGSIDTAHLADGQVTIGKLATAVLTGATDIGAAIVDADLLLSLIHI